MSKDKTQERGLLWNVNEKRIESVHEDKADAENAGRRFIEKSGSQQDLTDLAVATFTVPLPEPRADTSAESKKASDLAEKRAKEDGDRSADRSKEDRALAEKVSDKERERTTTHIPALSNKEAREQRNLELEGTPDLSIAPPRGYPESSTRATSPAKEADK